MYLTKEVTVTISGLQLADGEQDNIEMVHLGEYHEKDGVHYLFFDEMLEGHECFHQKERTGNGRDGI